MAAGSGRLRDGRGRLPLTSQIGTSEKTAIAPITGTGAHDTIVAATAITAGLTIATASIRHFSRIPGLDVLPVSLTG